MVNQQPQPVTVFIFSFARSRIHLTGLTGTAGKISSISQPGSDFSTKDSDNDKCICKCSQMLTGGRQLFLFVLARSNCRAWKAGRVALRLAWKQWPYFHEKTC